MIAQYTYMNILTIIAAEIDHEFELFLYLNLSVFFATSTFEKQTKTYNYVTPILYCYKLNKQH